MAMSKEHFNNLLARAKLLATARREKLAIDELQRSMETHKVETVSLLEAGGTDGNTREDQERNLEVISSLMENRTHQTDSSRETTLPSSILYDNSQYIPESEYTIDPITRLPIKRSSALGIAFSLEAVKENSVELTTISAPVKIGVTRDVVLNTKQTLALTTVISGASCVIIGAAGTGKTTSMRTITRALIDEKKLPIIREGTKYLQNEGLGAAILSFTRKAVNNIRHAVVPELKAHTLTLHKILEFAPEFFEIEDPNKPGEFKKSMRFIPTRNASFPLPAELKLIGFEESSMISTILYDQLQDAMPHSHQEIFIGDIQQLPPIFGQAILGFKMLELPIIELNEIYRQAAESPIIDVAWKILKGDKEAFSPKIEKFKKEVKGKMVDRIRVPALDKLSRKVTFPDGTTSEVIFQPWQKKLTDDYAILTTIRQFCTWAKQDYYFPQEDIILCPYNESVGTIEINKGIADYLGKNRNAEVHEVIAGYNKHYLAVGDRVLFDKEDAFITSIRKNGKYLGKPTLPASPFLDRWGHLALEDMSPAEKKRLSEAHAGDLDLAAVEAFLDSDVASVEDRVQAASHVIEIRYAYSEEFEAPEVLETAAEINNLLGGYCITVHKFQGSENERVFCLLHHLHQKLISRELLYTMVTRARSFLHIICEVDTFYKGIASQRIKGDTLEEKAEWFKGKVRTGERMYVSSGSGWNLANTYNADGTLVKDKE